MLDWVELLASGNPAVILVVVVLVIITGGVGAAIANGIYASRRGIKGDALVKEQNGIEGLSKLTDSQGSYIQTLENRINKMEEDFNRKLKILDQGMADEVEYSNLLITTLSTNQIPIPPRPVKPATLLSRVN